MDSQEEEEELTVEAGTKASLLLLSLTLSNFTEVNRVGLLGVSMWKTCSVKVHC